jgi:hypothetical protein
MATNTNLHDDTLTVMQSIITEFENEMAISVPSPNSTYESGTLEENKNEWDDELPTPVCDMRHGWGEHPRNGSGDTYISPVVKIAFKIVEKEKDFSFRTIITDFINRFKSVPIKIKQKKIKLTIRSRRYKNRDDLAAHATYSDEVVDNPKDSVYTVKSLPDNIDFIREKIFDSLAPVIDEMLLRSAQNDVAEPQSLFGTNELAEVLKEFSPKHNADLYNSIRGEIKSTRISTNNLSSSVKSITRLAEKFLDKNESEDNSTLKDILEVFTKYGNIAENMNVSGFTQIKENVIEASQITVAEIVTSLSALTGFVGSLVWWNQERTWFRSVFVIIALIFLMIRCGSRLLSLISDNLINYIGIIFNNKDIDDCAEPQSDCSIIDDMSKMIMVALGAFNIRTSASKIKSMFDISSKMSNSSNGLSETLTWGLRLFERLINFIREEMFDLKSLRFIESNNEKFNKLVKELDILYEKERKQEFVRNIDNYETLCYYITAIKQLMLSIPRDKNSAAYQNLLNVELRKITKIQVLFEAANINNQGKRVEPVGVLLRGPAGSGKSNLMEAITDTFLRETLSDIDFADFRSNRNAFIANRQAENVYWDGYNSKKKVTLFDDFGQAKDVAGSPDNEFMNMIRAINTFEYQLHMAQMEGKGNTFYRSDLVLASTNLLVIQPNSINHVPALMRRFPVSIIVVPKREFCTEASKDGGLYSRVYDPAKLPLDTILETGEETTTIGPHTQEFIPSDHEGRKCGEPMNFDQLMDFILVEHKKRKKYYQLKCQESEHILEKRKIRINERLQADFGDILVKEPQSGEEKFYPAECSDDIIQMHDIMRGRTNRNARKAMHNAIDDIDMRIIDKNLDNNDYQYIIDQDALDKDLAHFGPIMSDLIKKFLELRSNLPIDGIVIRDAELYSVFKHVFRDEAFSYDYYSLIAKCISLYSKPFFYAYMDCDFTILDTSNTYFRENSMSLKPYVEDFIPRKCENSIFFKLIDKWYKSSPYQIWSSFGPLIKGVTLFYGICIGITAINSVCVYAYMGISKIFGKEISKVEAEAQVGYNSGPLAKRKIHIPKAKVMRERLGHPQASSDLDSSGVDYITSLKNRNMFIIEVENSPESGEYQTLGNIFIVRGRIALMPLHFFKILINKLDKDAGYVKSTIRIKSVKAKSEFYKLLPLSSLFKNYSSPDTSLGMADAILVELPEVFQVCTDHLDSFMTDDDIANLDDDVNFLLPLAKETMSGIAHKYKSSVAIASDATGYYEIENSFAYPSITSKGDCGAVFCILNSKVPKRKIAGIHVAGMANANLAFSNVISREMLDAALESMDFGIEPPIIEQELESTALPQCGMETIPGFEHLNYLGTIENPPSKVLTSSIRKSALHNTMWPSIMKPALLRDINGQTPMKNAVKKYCVSHFILNKPAAEFAMNKLRKIFILSTSQAKREIFSVETVLEGREGLDAFNRIPSATSPGYPMNNGVTPNLKRMYYFEEGRKKEAYMKICIGIQSLIAMLKQGIRPEFYFTDNLKDERREIEKVLMGKTRLFQGCPFFYLILVKMFFGAFTRQCLRDRIKNFMTVGVNPYSTEWEIIYKLFLTYSPEGWVGAGDFGGFDGSEEAVIHNLILQLINEWYNDEYNYLRKILWLELTNSKHINEDKVFEWSGSLPSGHPLTIFVNSIYHIFAFYYVFYKLIIVTALKMDAEALVMQVCGDDGIFAVKAPYREYFNEMTVAPELAKIGLKYTTEMKETASVKWRKISEIEFLKRSFKVLPEVPYHVAPHRLEHMREICYWTRKGTLRDQITRDNVENVIREMSLHGRETFDDYVPRIRKKYSILYPHLPLRKYAFSTYEEVLHEVLDYEAYFQ